MKKAVFPDEPHHIKLSQLYSETLGKPSNSEESFHLGSIEKIPYIYHWISGRILNIKKVILPSADDLIVLRIFTVITGVINLYIAYEIVKSITKDKLQHILVVAMLSNTLMFSFSSAGVGYDPLLILFSFLSILLTLKLLEKNSLTLLLLLIITLLAGMLTKITFLPLALLVVIFVLVTIVKQRKEYLKEIKNTVKDKDKLKYLIPLLIVISFFLFLTLDLYLGNIIKYRSLTPSCTQVMKEEDCMKNPVFKRSFTFREKASPSEERLEPYWYIPHWVYLMINRTYGIFAHKSMVLSYEQFSRYFGIIVLGIILFLTNCRAKNSKYKFFISLILFYIFLLMYHTNYQGYLSHGLLHVAVQGRYIFPVIISIYILVVQGLLSFKNKYIRAIIFGLVLFIFVYGNMPFFMKNFTENWFFENSKGTEIIINTRDFLYTTNHNIRELLP
ncbi:MAG: glycosyltransferase family 39 protein [Candidatus Dojkabacteria bacterium]|nr:glycosyltransferase family 39 protein [Candidatus Dojkabacteria bacterium]